MEKYWCPKMAMVLTKEMVMVWWKRLRRGGTKEAPRGSEGLLDGIKGDTQ